MVDKRCAIKMVICSLLAEMPRIVFVISSSVSESRADVASSKISSRGCLSSARAIDNLCKRALCRDLGMPPEQAQGHSKVSGGTKNPSPRPSPTRGEGVFLTPSPLVGEGRGEGGEWCGINPGTTLSQAASHWPRRKMRRTIPSIAPSVDRPGTRLP